MRVSARLSSQAFAYRIRKGGIMTFWEMVVGLGILLGLWAAFRDKPNRKRPPKGSGTRAGAAQASPGRYAIKSGSDGYARVIDMQTGCCAYEATSRDDAAA